MPQQINDLEELTRQSVREIFQNMLSMDVTAGPAEPLPEDPAGQIIGSVGFIGDATGIIYLYAGITFARVITSQMLGIPEPEVENGDMVNDAIGELSNMVVGYVKSRLCDSGAPCTLTIPSVVRGQQLSVEGLPLFTRKVIGFRNGDYHLNAEVLLKESQG
jgi:chemotaxis protein CheX